MDFYTQLGFTNNPQFTDDTAACMVWSDAIFVMLLTKEKFKSFTNKEVADTKKAISVMNSLSLESADAVKDFVAKALAAGGTEPSEAKDYGFMIQHTIEDPDGNHWEPFFMDMSKFPQQ
ncbi:hypothetical protein GGU45_003157 [Niabella hirudinis]